MGPGPLALRQSDPPWSPMADLKALRRQVAEAEKTRRNSFTEKMANETRATLKSLRQELHSTMQVTLQERNEQIAALRSQLPPRT